MADINEIISKEAIQSIVSSDTAITTLDQSTKEFIKTIETLNSALKKNDASQKTINKTIKQSEDATKKLTQIEKDQLAAEKALEKQRQRGLASMAKQEAKERELIVAINKEVKSEQDLINKTNALIQKRKLLDQTTQKGIAEHKKLSAEINKNTNALKSQDKQIGKSQRNVGNYGSALKGVGTQLMGALGLTAGVALFVSALKSAFNTIFKFGQAQATLAATLGKTRNEIKSLTEDAIAYGKGTKFTATEVSGLQNELAKLGFTMGEISLMTDGVLKLAEATGADLSEAAKTTGIALKSFNLAASESTTAAATLAIATTKSALSFADYETSLSTVGAVANAFGFSLQDTIALIGKLRDAGFDASKASTALRNILLNLADSNGALSQKLGGSIKNIDEFIPALIKLKSEGVDLNETLQLTDKRSVAAFNTLLTGGESVLVLRDAITDVNSALDEMVTTKTDNTIDAMTRLGSAWDGVVLSFRNSEGFFTTFFNWLGNTLNTFTDKYTTGFDKYIAALSAGLINLGAKDIKARKEIFDNINKLNEKELTELANSYRDKAAMGDEFSKDVLNKATERIRALREADKKAADKKAQDEIDAARIISEANAEMLKEKNEISQKTIELSATETELKIMAIDKEARNLLKAGINEVAVARWVAREKKKISDGILKEKRKDADEILALEQEVDDAIEKMQDEFMADMDKKADEDLQSLKDEIALKQELRNEEYKQRSKDEEQLAREIEQLKLQLISESVAATFDIIASGYERQFNELQTEKERELALVEGNKAAEDAINEKYAKKEAELKTKAAKAAKAGAMITAATNTALAIVSAYSTPPAPVGIALGVLMAALGAVQIATIAAQPIPKFFKGTDSAPSGNLIAGDRGRELISTTSGQLLMANKPTVMSGLEGAKIYTNKETEAIMRGKVGYDSLDLRGVIDSNRAVERAIKNIPRVQIDRSNRTITERSGSYAKKYLNAKVYGI